MNIIREIKKINLQKLFICSLFIFNLFFIGCSVKTKSVYTVIKTPFIKLSDEGFLEKGIYYKKIIVYKNGNYPIEIVVKSDEICVNKKCYSKYLFAKRLSVDYPKNLLDLIIDKKPIKNLGKIIKLKNGFLQKNSRFFYLVTKNKVLFKDKLKGIFIMIKDIK